MKKKKNIFDYSPEEISRLTPSEILRLAEAQKKEALKIREAVEKQVALTNAILGKVNRVSHKNIAKAELNNSREATSGDLQKWNSQPETELFSSTDETYILPVSQFVRVIPFLFCFGTSYFSVNRLN